MKKQVSWKHFYHTIKQHMGRVHVSTPDSKVEEKIREAVYAFRVTHLAEYRVSKATENACVRFALRCHEENKQLYAKVMRGRI